MKSLKPDISVRTNGAYYEVVKEGNVVYGGSGNIGGIDGSSFSDVVHTASDSLQARERFYDGFEQDFSVNWASKTGNITRDNSYGVEYGNYSARAYVTDSSGSSYVSASLSQFFNALDVRFFVQVNSLPSLWCNEIFLVVRGPNGDIARIGYYGTDNGLAVRLIRSFPYNEVASSPLGANINTTTRNALELRFISDANNGSYQVFFNGNLVINDTGLDTSGSGGAKSFIVGLYNMDSSTPATAWIDDVEASTSYIGLSEGSGALGGGVIEIEAGNYASDKTASIGNNIVLFGHGDSTFIQQVPRIAKFQSIFQVGPSIHNVTIENMWIDGNKAHQANPEDMMRQGVLIYWAHNVTVQNMRITNMTQCGVDAAYSYNLTVQNCRISGSGDGDIWIDISTNDYVVRNNICTNIFLVFFDNDGNHTGLVTGNTVINSYGFGIECWRGLQVNPYGVTISNNIIVNSANSGICLQGFSNCTVENNTCTGNAWDGLSLYNSASFNIIRYNTFTNNSNLGIRVQSGSNHNTIIYNDLRHNGWGGISDNVAETYDTVYSNLG
jgi:parallel beta-helix repeat protein